MFKSLLLATSIAIAATSVHADASACSNMFPAEYAKVHMVQYPIHMSFHVPEDYQDARNWKYLRRSINKIENEIRDILDTHLYYISLKDTPCSDEDTNKICIAPNHIFTGAVVGNARTSNRDSRPRDIPDLLINVKESYFRGQTTDAKRDEFSALRKHVKNTRKPYVEAWRKEIKELRTINRELKNERNLIDIEIEKKALDLEALEFEQMDVAQRDERTKALEAKINELMDRYDAIRSQRRSNKSKIRDLRAKVEIRLLSDLERLIIHELLHGAGFKHSRDESNIMAKAMCNVGVNECVPQVRDSERKRLYNNFVCMSEKIGYSGILDKAYNTKAKASHKAAHEDTTKLEDWARAIEYDLRLQRRMRKDEFLGYIIRNSKPLERR